MVNKIPNTLENPVDVLIYNHIDAHLAFYKKLGFTPNGLTTLSLGLGLCAIYFVCQKYYKSGALLWFAAYYYDCADGKLARKYKMTSKFGDFYDHCSDLVKHALLIGVLCMYYIRKGQWLLLSALVVMFLVVGFLVAAQMGCQERYVKENENAENSETLQILDYFVLHDNCAKQMQVTRFFTPGTLTILFMCVILSLRK